MGGYSTFNDFYFIINRPQCAANLRFGLRKLVSAVRFSQRFGIVRGFGWLVDGPEWLRLAMGFIITPGMMLALAICVEGRLPNISHQYQGFLPGDLFLAVAWAIATWAAVRFVPPAAWHTSRWFQVVKIGMAVAMLLSVVPEIVVMVAHAGQPNVMVWPAFFSPTKLYHTLLLPAYGYLMTAVLTPVIASMPWRNMQMFAIRMLVIVSLLGWDTGIYYDNTHPRPPAKFVDAPQGWPWQRVTFWQQ